ncbi:MAG: class I SAM-dependent methyltransferase [candidate division WOR-3 bacterium]|nr:class I SAM-dependent methyltransferase [candidate division WOR-3 bacterium]
MATGKTSGLDGAVEILFFNTRNWLQPPRRNLEEAGLQPGWHVLDFGCGVGGHSIAAARLVGETGRVYAADVKPLMVEQVRKRAASRRLANVTGIVTDCATGLADQSLDAILLYDVFHDLEQPGQVMEELVRVLKPEGILSFSDHHLEDKQIIAGVTAGGRFRPVRRERLTWTFAPAGADVLSTVGLPESERGA